MPLSRLIRSRRLVQGILAVLVIVFAVRAGIPFLIRTDTVGAAIEDAIESWTGAEAQIGHEARIEFWPYPRVTLGNVRLRARGAAPAETQEIARIDAISATFNLFGAVRGEPAFGDFELVRPLVTISRDADGSLNWPHGGWLKEAVEAVAAAPDGEDPRLRHERIGTINFKDGSLIVAGQSGSEPFRLSDMNGSLSWPSIRNRVQLSLSAIMNGETMRWTLSCERPLALLAGRNAQIRAELASDPASGSFEGMANLSNNGFIAGDLRLATPSLPHLLTWQGKDVPVIDNVGRLELSAKVTTGGYAAKLENVRLVLAEAQASGILDISMAPDGVPQLGGTLAFDRIDLRGVVAALSAPSNEKGDTAGFDTAFMRQFGLDLRLSAKEAGIAPFRLENLAAGIRVADGRASFDIGDSALLGGHMNGRILLTEQGFSGGAQLRLSLDGVDMAAIADTLALNGPLPLGRGSADFELATDRPLWLTRPADVTGKFRLTMAEGRLVRFDLQAFERLAAEGSFFNMAEAAGDEFDFAHAEIQATLDKGIAELTSAVIESNDKALTLSGIVPYRSGSVALAGTLADRQPADAETVRPALSFFVGGSWPEPVISPVSVFTGQSGR